MIGLLSRHRQESNPVQNVHDTWTPSHATSGQWQKDTASRELPSRTVCAASGCDREPKFWKKTARPVIEGQWCCSRRCAEEIVHATMMRLSQGRQVASPTDHRHRIPLGLVLLEQGAVTYFQLRQALDAQKEAGHGRIGEWLDELCGVSGADVARALARQWNRPVLSAAGFNARQMALVLPAPLRNALRMVPVRVAGGKYLYVAFEGPVDPVAEAVISGMLGLQVESGLLPDEELKQVKRGLGHASAPKVHECSVESAADVVSAIARMLFEHQPVSSRVACLRGTWWLRMFLEPAAMSDTASLPSGSEDVLDVLFTPSRSSASHPVLSGLSSAV